MNDMHELDGKCILVEDTDITFESIYQKPYVTEDILTEIQKADMLLIPDENLRKNAAISFPELTEEFFAYLRKNAGDNLIVDIAVSDEDFQKLEMHSAVLQITSFIVLSVFLPLAVSLLANYLYDEAKKHRRKTEDISAHVDFVVQEGSKSKRITYDGPVSGVKEALEAATSNLFSGE